VDAAHDTAIGRRVVLGMLALGGAGIVWGSRVADGLSRLLAPITAADRTGITALFPAAGGFRIYSVTGSLPRRTRDEWSMVVDGLVDRPATVRFTDLAAMPQRRVVRDFQCVTGWRVRQVAWSGVRLSDVLDAAGVQDAAKAVRLESFDGVYTESLTLDQARLDDVFVATAMRDKPISTAHGGPVRIFVGPMYGYKSLKWLSRIELTPDVIPGYWERRGYDIDAFVGKSNARDDDPT